MLIFNSVEEVREYCRTHSCKYCDFGSPYGSHYYVCDYIGYDDYKADRGYVYKLSDEQIKERFGVSN